MPKGQKGQYTASIRIEYPDGTSIGFPPRYGVWPREVAAEIKALTQAAGGSSGGAIAQNKYDPKVHEYTYTAGGYWSDDGYWIIDYGLD